MMILLTGGSAAGKSTLAQTLCAALPAPRCYVGTMRLAGPGSAQERRRRARMRGAGFEVCARVRDLAGFRLPQPGGTAILDCLCNLADSEMFGPNGARRDPGAAVLSGVESLRAQCRDLIVVTNEISCDGRAYDESTRAYIAALGRLNAALAAAADVVCELVCGIPVLHRGALPAQAPAVAAAPADSPRLPLLIVGGEGAGKRAFAQSCGFSAAEMADGRLTEAPVVCHAEQLVLHGLREANLLAQLTRKKAVLLCEAGCGVMPADPAERAFREAAGRLGVQLAQRADTVVRLVCGLPFALKGTLPRAATAPQKEVLR